MNTIALPEAITVGTHTFTPTYANNRRAVVLDQESDICVDEGRAVYKRWAKGERHADIYFIGRLIATVRVERQDVGPELKSSVSWTALGPQDIRTANGVGATIVFASELARHMLNGFSFMDPR